MNRPPNNRSSRSLVLVALLVAAGLATGCDSPMGPANDDAMGPTLMAAQVLLNGEVVNGQVMHHGQIQGNGTLFQATLTGPGGGPGLGYMVQVQYQTPGGGPGGMMHGQGLMQLYDDGTHGDPFAGDGIYCYLDEPGQYGFHIPWAPAGQYHYEFYGYDHQQHHSNHMSVVVTVSSG